MNEIDRTVELEYRDNIAHRLGGDAAECAGEAK